MREDLLFHLTTEKQWNQHKSNGKYKPESLNKKGFIHCSSGHQIEQTANRFFSDQSEIILIIIDTARLSENVKYEKDEDIEEVFPHLYNSLDVGAIIDKIKVQAEKDGTFKISFNSDSG